MCGMAESLIVTAFGFAVEVAIFCEMSNITAYSACWCARIYPVSLTAAFEIVDLLITFVGFTLVASSTNLTLIFVFYEC